MSTGQALWRTTHDLNWNPWRVCLYWLLTAGTLYLAILPSMYTRWLRGR